MSFAEQQRGHHAIDHGRRLRLFLLDGGERLAAKAIEFLVGERRVQQHVGIQIERLRQPSAERIHVEKRAIERRADGQRRAERLGRAPRSASELRVFVPSWSMSMESRAVPGLADASAAKPASASSVKSTTGRCAARPRRPRGRSTSFARSGAGSFSDGAAPGVGTLLRSTVLASGLERGHGLDVEHEHAIRHPALGRRPAHRPAWRSLIQSSRVL